jgi:hypothetical protein
MALNIVQVNERNVATFVFPLQPTSAPVQEQTVYDGRTVQIVYEVKPRN